MALSYYYPYQERVEQSITGTPNEAMHGPYLCHYDMWRQQNWELHTHGGFLTYPHHDAAGLCTYVYVESGAKLWCFFRPNMTLSQPKTRGQLFRSMDNMCGFGGYDKHEQAGTVLLEPGDILYDLILILHPFSTNHLLMILLASNPLVSSTWSSRQSRGRLPVATSTHLSASTSHI